MSVYVWEASLSKRSCFGEGFSGFSFFKASNSGSVGGMTMISSGEAPKEKRLKGSFFIFSLLLLISFEKESNLYSGDIRKRSQG